jgi:methyl-accepting chemotaxis protein
MIPRRSPFELRIMQMQGVLSRMSITRQFTILAFLGVVLTLAGLALTMKRSYDLEFEAKRAEVRHLTEGAVSLMRSYIQQEQSGALSKAEAQKRAAEALGAIRFDNNNFYIGYTYSGVTLNFPQKEVIGTNRLNVTDSNGKAYVRAFIEKAQSGQPGFVEYEFPKPGETQPLPKISYVAGLPEWQWVIGTGLYVDNVMTTLIDGVVKVAEIFVPLLLGFTLIVFFMRRTISRLLSSLADTMRRMAQGDLQTEIVGRGRSDEIGQMAEALVTFHQAAIDKARLESAAEDQRQVLEAERRRKADVDKGAMEATRQVVESLGQALAGLSQGDLTSYVAEAYSAEYEAIRENFNAAVAQLRDAMAVMATNTSTIKSGTNDISTAADDLSRRTEQQAASLEETAAALDEITVTVTRTSEGADHARQVVNATRSDAERSGEVVRQAIEAMAGIEASSKQIGQIIGVIDEIAFQTNLLALNAGVEAARAGEAGRGFAVVASEVRALAQRSAEAAKEIKTLVSTSTQQVDQGVDLVSQTGKALEHMMAQVAQISEVVTTIAASAREQATGLAQINTAINEMDQTTQQNAAMVAESTAASHSLAHEADELSQLMNRFKTGSNQAATPSTGRNTSRARTVVALKTVNARGGSVARKPETQSATESWEEF